MSESEIEASISELEQVKTVLIAHEKKLLEFEKTFSLFFDAMDKMNMRLEQLLKRQVKREKRIILP